MAYKHILAMTDFSDFSNHAVQIAAQIAQCQGSKLTVLHVAYDQSQFQIYIDDKKYNEIREKIDEEINEKFDLLEDVIPELKNMNWESTIRRGTPYIEGLYEIESGDYDLVVIGSHGESGIKRFVYGSTAGKILRHSPISVHITKS
jgi:nucleotide-binding universal stress UspA family protein